MEILQFCTKPSICKIQCNSYSPFSCSQCFMTSHKVTAGMNSRCSRSPFGSCNATTTGSSLAAVSGSAATNSSLAWLGRPENRNGKVRSNTFRPCLQQYSSNVSPNGLNCKTCLFHLLHTEFIIFNRLRAEQNGPPLADNILKFICLKKTYLFEENSFPRAHEMLNFRPFVFHSTPVTNTLWPSDAIWQPRTGSILAWVMAWCLATLSHNLNQCWLISSKIKKHSSVGNFTRDTVLCTS